MNEEPILDGPLADDERRLLLGARRALSPTDADAQRVLAATLGSLAIAAAETAAGSPPAAQPATHAAPSAIAQSTAQAAAGWTALPKLLAALALAGATGVLGYGLGFRAGQATPPRPAQTAVLAAPGPASDSVSDSVSESDSVSVSASVPLPNSDSVSASAPSLPRHPVSTPLRPTAEPDPTPLEPDPNALALELRALRRIERALRDAQPRRALELLGELDRDVPEGRLVEERLATFLMARCALGLGAPERLRSEFTGSYPRSVYRARVEQSCRDGGREE